MALNRTAAFIRSLLGIKGKDGSAIATTANPVPVEIGDGARTATVRDTGASDSLNVSVVDASGNQITSFGGGSGGTQYTEDVASVADPVGNQLAARRRDALATETTTDGDVTALNSTAKGELYVKHVDSVPVTGTFFQTTQPVSGTVAATQSGTWTVQPGNTANTTAWKVDGSAVTQPVSAASLPLPSGAATSANQSTEITALQLLDDVVATTAAAIPAKGYAVSGTDGTNARVLKTDTSGELQIDVLTSALPSGAATSALQTQPGVDIGDVTVNNASGASAVNIQDGGNSITVDGVFFQATQPVSAASLPLPSGAATSANQSTEITALQLLDDVPHGANVAFSKGTPVMGQFDDASTGTVTEDNVAAVRITSGRALHVAQQGTTTVSGTVTANAGTGPFPVSDNAGSLTVDAPVGTPAFVRLSDGSAPITTLPVSLASVPTHGVTGTFWQATQPVSAASLPLPSGAATSAIQTTQQTALDNIKLKTDNIPAQGQALAAASLPVVLTAAQVTTLTPPAAITGFATATTQTDGNQKAQVTVLPVDTYSTATVATSSSGNTALATPAAGKKIRLHYLNLNADGANAADVSASVRFGASGALKYTNSLKAGSIFARNIGAGRRYIEGAANEVLNLNLSVGQTVNATVEYEEIT